jgi:hypothetical protein
MTEPAAHSLAKHCPVAIVALERLLDRSVSLASVSHVYRDGVHAIVGG